MSNSKAANCVKGCHVAAFDMRLDYPGFAPSSPTSPRAWGATAKLDKSRQTRPWHNGADSSANHWPTSQGVCIHPPPCDRASPHKRSWMHSIHSRYQAAAVIITASDDRVEEMSDGVATDRRDCGAADA